jgi:hypothetical protein
MYAGEPMSHVHGLISAATHFSFDEKRHKLDAVKKESNKN